MSRRDKLRSGAASAASSGAAREAVQVATAVGVMEEEKPREVAQETPVPEPPTRERAAQVTARPSAAAGDVDAAMALVQELTGRIRRGERMERVSFKVNAGVMDQLGVIDDRVALWDVLGPGVHPINRVSLVSEAVRRVSADPARYAPPSSGAVGEKVTLASQAPKDAWDVFIRAHYQFAKSTIPYGAFLSNAIEEILTEITPVLPKK